MRVAQVVGTVTLNRCLPEFIGARLKVALPYSLQELLDDKVPSGPMVVAWDELGADTGCQIALAEGPEASQPFRPKIKPVDAYNAAILDDVSLDPNLKSS